MKRSAERLFRESPAFRKIVGTVKGIESGEFDLQCIIETAEDARARNDIDPDERDAIADDLGKFRTEFARIIESDEFCPKESVLRAVRLALLIGSSTGLPRDKLTKLRSIMMSEEMTQRAQNKRPNGVSPFTTFFQNKLDRNPDIKPHAIREALLTDARCGVSGKFLLSEDETAIIYADDHDIRLKVCGIAAAISKARDKNSKK